MSIAINPALLGPATPADPSSSRAEQNIRQAAQGFETILVRQMLRELRQSSWSTAKSDVNSGYLELGDEQMANHIVQSGGLGFAKAMANQMLQQIEAAKLIAGAVNSR